MAVLDYFIFWKVWWPVGAYIINSEQIRFFFVYPKLII